MSIIKQYIINCEDRQFDIAKQDRTWHEVIARKHRERELDERALRKDHYHEDRRTTGVFVETSFLASREDGDADVRREREDRRSEINMRFNRA